MSTPDITTDTPPAERIERALRLLKRSVDTARVQRQLVELTGVDLDYSSFGLLMLLRERGPARLSDVATTLDLDLSVISRRVRALEERDFVERAADPDDARASRIQLSSAGTDIAARMAAGRHTRLAAAISSWSSDDAQHFADLLERFAHAIIDIQEPPS